MAQKGKSRRAEQFYKRMEKLLGSSEAQHLMKAIGQITPKSVRYNRNLCALDQLKGAPVPWCQPYGRYWEGEGFPSRTLEYTAGKYYIQEASAMLAISAASTVIDFPGKIVLDLTAAPGGKATQAAELLQTGYLVANEVIKKRVNALTWNINRHRLNNVVITSLPTKALAEALPGFFDVVIVDAPCSGEGLFKKQKHSLENWSEKNVRFCAARQTTILKDAVTLTRIGGYIVYATCTFAGEENEDQVEFLLNQGFHPVTLPGDLPVSPAVSGNKKVCLCSRRIFPHREGGAGAFVSVVQKHDSTNKELTVEYAYESSAKLRRQQDHFPHIHMKSHKGYFYEKNGITGYFSNERVPGFLRKHAYQLGAPVIDKYRSDECMFGSVQLPSPGAIIEVGEEEAEAYVRGQELQLDRANGYYYIALRGMILGPVKVTNGRAVNKLPKPLRNML